MSKVYHGQWRETDDDRADTEEDALDACFGAWSVATKRGVKHVVGDYETGLYVHGDGDTVIAYVFKRIGAHGMCFHALTVVANGEVILGISEEFRPGDEAKDLSNVRYLVHTFRPQQVIDFFSKLRSETSQGAVSISHPVNLQAGKHDHE